LIAGLTALQVRALKGAPISILFLMLIERTPLSQEYLRRYTGYSDEAVHDAVQLLKDHDLVVQVGRYEWALTAGARQLPLGATPLEGGEEEGQAAAADHGLGETAPNPTPQPATEDPEEIRSDISGPGYLASSSRSLNPDQEVNQPLLARARSSGKSGAVPPNPEILAVLDEHGVREPARSRLARLAHVTPELIDYHCKTAQNTGLAIYRIEKNWAVKTEPEEGAGSGKYYEGEFGEFVEH
jgi:hypothetical protein